MNFNELFQKMRELDAPVSEELRGKQKELDTDKDGDIEADDLKDLRDKKVDENLVDECGDMPMPGSMSSPKQQDNVTMNISMNGSGAGGIRDLMNILRDLEDGSGDGDMDGEMGVIIDKMAGDDSDREMPLLGMDEAEAGGFDQASTTPNPQTAPVGAAFPTGNDMHSKGEEFPKVNGGGNAMTMESLTNRLANLYQEVKLRESSGEQVDEWGVNLTQPNAGVLGRNPGAPYQDNANLNRVAAKYDDYIKKYKQEIKDLKASSTATMPGTVGLISTLEKTVDGLQSEKIHNMMAGSIADNTNAQRKQAIANNELTPGQWLQKATQYFKGKITGKEQPGVEYDHIDNSKQGKPGWDTPTPYKPEAVPMKESNEIVALSKMLNG